MLHNLAHSSEVCIIWITPYETATPRFRNISATHANTYPLKLVVELKLETVRWNQVALLILFSLFLSCHLTSG